MKTLDRPTGKLAENVLHFARALRAAGLPVGPTQSLAAAEAAAACGLNSRSDLYWTLHACLVSKPEHRALFHETFEIFWRDPQLGEKLMGLLLPEMKTPNQQKKPRAAQTRAQQAMVAGADNPPPPPPPVEGEEIEFDARLAWSANERLKSMDFEQMTAAEERDAKAALAKLDLRVDPILSRRLAPHPRGKAPDWRATMRAAMRRPDAPELLFKARRERPPTLVALCDISGSMSKYSRMLLHFLHAASNAKGAGWAKVHSFVFGTRLTNITRHMDARDADDALARAGAEAQDWEGGTRIGACLKAFNRDWSRRVLGQGAVVLLITDGLDREDPAVLEAEARRLHLSCRRLVWLNPLLRWDGFEARARGVKALLPHVDSFRAAHNIDSLSGLAAALTATRDHGERDRLLAAMKTAPEEPERWRNARVKTVH